MAMPVAKLVPCLPELMKTLCPCFVAKDMSSSVFRPISCIAKKCQTTAESIKCGMASASSRCLLRTFHVRTRRCRRGRCGGASCRRHPRRVARQAVMAAPLRSLSMFVLVSPSTSSECQSSYRKMAPSSAVLPELDHPLGVDHHRRRPSTHGRASRPPRKPGAATRPLAEPSPSLFRRLQQRCVHSALEQPCPDTRDPHTLCEARRWFATPYPSRGRPADDAKSHPG